MAGRNNKTELKPFRFDGAFYEYTGKLFDLMVLSILWTLCCIPVVTAGASACALFTAVTRSLRQNEGGAVRTFITALKRNFKPSVIPAVASVVLIAVLMLNLGILLEQKSSLLFLFLIIFFGFCLAAVVSLCCYIFPFISSFDMPLKWYAGVSLYAAVKHLPLTLVMTVLAVMMYFLILWQPVFLIILPGVFSMVSSYMLDPVLKEFIPKD